MKINNEFNERQIELLKKINVDVNQDYNENTLENFDGMFANVKSNIEKYKKNIEKISGSFMFRLTSEERKVFSRFHFGTLKGREHKLFKLLILLLLCVNIYSLI